MRKTIAINKEVEQARERLAEMERLKLEADTEEKALLDAIEAEIKDIADRNDMFCGAILGKEDIVSIVQLALNTGGQVQIPFKLYYKEKN
ncbi:MAG TPA: hypothetical protein VLH16_02100 [Bacteroidales bacterium]|nr:hypothetical protein [Bacteroidales bacterium]